MDKSIAVFMGIFSHSDDVLHAAEQARDKGWKDLDMVTPFPVHGSEKALGLKASWVPYVTLTMGLVGAVAGFAFEHWALAVSWPLNIGGKPLTPWPAYVPIMFECGILLGGISTFVAMLVASRLPKARPVIYDERLTNDKFALLVPLHEGMTPQEIEEFFKGVGADEVHHVGA
jgi:hypothetical protein